MRSRTLNAANVTFFEVRPRQVAYDYSSVLVTVRDTACFDLPEAICHEGSYTEAHIQRQFCYREQGSPFRILHLEVPLP